MLDIDMAVDFAAKELDSKIQKFKEELMNELKSSLILLFLNWKFAV